MQNTRLIFTFLLFFIAKITVAQDPSAIDEYIKTYKDIAISEMIRTGVPASIKLAQGIHETEAGRSDLVISSNNHFGIKCKSAWTGQSVLHDDDSHGECFRKYANPIDSYKDHSDFLKGSPRYAFLFELDPTDYEKWAYGLKKAGYATNPRYPQILIKLINDYHLQDYTLIALGRKQNEPELAVINEVNQVKEDPVSTIVTPLQIIERPVTLDNYPKGEFKINETRVVYVRKGTSYLSIAQQYDIPLARIFEFNDLQEQEAVTEDQLVYIQRKRKTGNNEYHTVLAGENINFIAQSEAIRIESLLEYNSLQRGMQPAAGEILYLRAKAPAMPKLAKNIGNVEERQRQNALTMNAKTPETQGLPDMGGRSSSGISGNPILHTVQPKEGLYSIAKKYEVSVNELVNWNQLQGYELKIGQQLKIYK